MISVLISLFRAALSVSLMMANWVCSAVLDASLCGGCGRPALGGWGSYISALGRSWHQGCFCCGHCKLPMAESFVTEPSGHVPFHAECYRLAFGQHCCVCADIIPEVVRTQCHSYRENAWHTFHKACGVPPRVVQGQQPVLCGTSSISEACKRQQTGMNQGVRLVMQRVLTLRLCMSYLGGSRYCLFARTVVNSHLFGRCLSSQQVSWIRSLT